MRRRGLARSQAAPVPHPTAFPRLLAASLAVFLAAFAQIAPGQKNAEPDLPLSNRYLFVVETTRAMHGRADAAADVVKGLLNSGFQGQLHSGDMIGLWTFNERLYQGRMAFQEWNAGTRLSLAVGLLDSLRAQVYEKRCNLRIVMAELENLARQNEFLTVILISSGDDEVHGTPFDDQINQSYRELRAGQSNSQLPLVTVLRARQGEFAVASVTAAPQRVELPAFPGETPVFQARRAEPETEPTNSAPPLAAREPVKPEVKTNAPPAPARIDSEGTRPTASAKDAGSPAETVAGEPPPDKPVESQATKISSSKDVQPASTSTADTSPAKPVAAISRSQLPSSVAELNPPQPAEIREAGPPAPKPPAPRDVLAGQGLVKQPPAKREPLPAAAAAADDSVIQKIFGFILVAVPAAGAIVCFRLWLRRNRREHVDLSQFFRPARTALPEQASDEARPPGSPETTPKPARAQTQNGGVPAEKPSTVRQAGQPRNESPAGTRGPAGVNGVSEHR